MSEPEKTDAEKYDALNFGIKKAKSPASNEQPLLMRWTLRIGGLFGLFFVPDMHLRVVRRMGRYLGARDAGFHFHNRLLERLGPELSLRAQRQEHKFEQLMSRDGLPFTMYVSILFNFDPRNGPLVAPGLTSLPPKDIPDVIAGLVKMFLRSALSSATNEYHATQLTLREVRERMEVAVKDTMSREMSFAGIGLITEQPVRILRVDPPEDLTKRQVTVAQRRVNILAGTEFHLADFRRALITEFIEHLAQTGAGESIVNFDKLLEAYAAERQSGSLPPTIDNPPQSTLGKDEPRPHPPTVDNDSQSTRRPKSRL